MTTSHHQQQQNGKRDANNTFFHPYVLLHTYSFTYIQLLLSILSQCPPHFCMQWFILPPVLQDMSKTQRENILNQASFPTRVWTLAQEVMDLFERGHLKGQNKPKKGVFDIKQHHLQPLHHLKEDFQVIQCNWFKQKRHSVIRHSLTSTNVEHSCLI